MRRPALRPPFVGSECRLCIRGLVSRLPLRGVKRGSGQLPGRGEVGPPYLGLCDRTAREWAEGSPSFTGQGAASRRQAQPKYIDAVSTEVRLAVDSFAYRSVTEDRDQ